MAVGTGTFINDMLARAGFSNAAQELTRYPELDMEAMIKLQPDAVFLSSEPYPFTTDDIAEMKLAFLTAPSQDPIKPNVTPDFKVVDGESQVTTSFEDASLQKKFFDFLDKSDFYGHITLQAIIDDSNKVHVIECNPRVGGASMLSIHAGLESFFWFFSEVLGGDLTAYPFIPANKLVTLGG